MDTPSYSVEQLVETLKDARIARGLSQRELAEQANLGQSRLALIEGGGVDLRTSTLVQLARALDLELVLAPRRVLPAVQSLTRPHPKPWTVPERRSVRGTPVRVLRRIQQLLADLERTQASSPEALEDLMEAKRMAQLLIEVGSSLDSSTLPPLRRSGHLLWLARVKKEQARSFIAKAAQELQDVRKSLPDIARLAEAPSSQRAVYSLEDEIS